ncbi:TetR-like C-terminal domain-containing protein [Streptomyces sp. NPDC086989]|uniref:TetR-like C-terminal domain-containing protein n=1 Tax=Streptomyces sp. NPDC086989 TaxID=3365764 RepID=UPI00382BC5FB
MPGRVSASSALHRAQRMRAAGRDTVDDLPPLGDLQELLSDVAVERLRPDTAPHDYGALSSDLTAWAEQFLDEMASPTGPACIRDALLGDPDRQQRRPVLGLRRRANRPRPHPRHRTRGEDARGRTVIDRVVAPMMYRILCRPDGLDAAYARRLVAEVLGQTGPTR